MTPEQCRQARERLTWSRYDLAKAADAPLWFVAAFEDDKEPPAFLAHYEIAMREALERRGIGFPFELADGRMQALDVTYSPKDEDEASGR
jgi:hypothetical protein